MRAMDRTTQKLEWEVFNFVTHGLLRILPTLLIIALNLAMYQRIREIMSSRRRLFKLQKKKADNSSLSKTGQNKISRGSLDHTIKLKTISGEVAKAKNNNTLQVPNPRPNSPSQPATPPAFPRRRSATVEAIRRVIKRT